MPRKPPPPNGGAPWQTPPRRRQQPRRDPRRSWPSGSRSCHSVRVSHRAGWASAARPTDVSILDACCVRSTAARRASAGTRWRASRCLRARPGCRTCCGMGNPRPTWQLWRRRRGKQAAPPRRRPRLSKPCGTSWGGGRPHGSLPSTRKISTMEWCLFRGPAGRGARHAGQVRHHQHRDG